MLSKILISICLLLTFSQQILAQQGSIAGKVIDKESAEPLMGAIINVEGKDMGAAADLDGNYTIKLDPGTYDISATYLGYTNQTITGIVVKVNETTNIDILLATESESLNEVIVTAQEIRNTDASIVMIQRKSYSVQDGISAQQIGRTGSSNAAESMKQMTGANVEDGKYMVMRGLGDRYSIAQMNGMTLQSTNPYRNSTSMDMIPSSMIDNIVTVKTFTPDLPGNFAGGLMNVTTKSFPDRLNVNLSLSTSYNTQTTFKDLSLGQRGKYDWLGYDDGGRQMLPALEQEETRRVLNNSTYIDVARSNPDFNNLRNTFNETSKSFSNDFIPVQRQAPLNHGFNFSIGNQVYLFQRKLGFSAGVNYSRDFLYYENGKVTSYQNNRTDELYAFQDLRESRSVENPQIGGLINIAYELKNNHTLSANFVYNNDAENSSRIQQGSSFRLSNSSALLNVRSIEFIRREAKTFQLGGKHLFPEINGLEIEWKGGITKSNQTEPDIKYMNYSTTYENAVDADGNDTGGKKLTYAMNNAELSLPGHYFRNLNDIQKEGRLDFTLPFGPGNKIKFGGLYSQLNRDFDEYRYELFYPGSSKRFESYDGNFDAFFSEKNFGIIDTLYNNQGQVSRYVPGYYYTNRASNRNFYSGHQKIGAGYAMVVFNITPKLKAIGGLRLESTDLYVKSKDTTLPEGKIKRLDYLPSVNLVYALNQKSNLRIAAAQTLARPNLREIAPFSRFDTEEGFFDVGNPALRSTLIKNGDLRWELYPSGGELIAVSAYYKYFQNPILRQFNPRATIPEISYINIDDAYVTGIELELRKSLKAINPVMTNFYFSTNLSLIYSKTEMLKTEIESAKGIDESYSQTSRPFQGQSPYIINAILSYVSDSAGLESSLSFNVSGKRLYAISMYAAPDVYEQPRPMLDYKISKNFGKHLVMSFTAKNLLNARIYRTQTYKGQEFVSRGFKVGRTFGFSVGYRL